MSPTPCPRDVPAEGTAASPCTWCHRRATCFGRIYCLGKQTAGPTG